VKKNWVTLLVFISLCPAVFAQQDTIKRINLDTVEKVQIKPAPKKDRLIVEKTKDTITYQHSPKKAMLLSALLPGSGQIYNKKYWKAPVVWTGFAVFGYFINQNNREYQRFRRAYNYNVDEDSTTISEFPNVSPNLLANERDIFRKWRDLSIILTVGWYALNIIDANVDAHLFEFDVSDVARVRWEPTFNMALNRPRSPLTGGLRLSLTF
jgi:hypothetical protein